MNESRDDDGHGRRLRAETAERLLDGTPCTEADTGDPRVAGLAHLLAAAATPLPGRPEDEHAVLEAFRAAARTRPAGSPAADRQAAGGSFADAVRRAARRRRSVKVLVAGAVAAFALGGVAIAAQTGALPGPFGPHRPGPSASVVPTTGGASGAPGTTGSSGGGRTSPGASGTPSGASPRVGRPSTAGPGHPHDPAGTKGLCAVYVKAAAKGKAVGSAAEARLARAAGGTGRIGSYCAGLLGADSAAGHASPPPATRTSAGPSASAAPPEPSAAPEHTTDPDALKPAPTHTGQPRK